MQKNESGQPTWHCAVQSELRNGHEIHAHVAGKIRMLYIRILPGHRISVIIPS
ncbi:MAG: hypothetical protein Q4D46_01390 [Erysipelotrichaceae bacterium]|nr:hypothetical protein [Erysipelotrichaceae bacterium]MDO5120707.1 hypothetical protein [Erysipelotrichaceae bacterium]